VPRPLRTGGQFTIVLPKKRVLYRHWNKEVFLPGEEADLIVETDGTDGEKYELILEKAPAEDGPWEQVTSLEAKADGGRAKAKYKFPKPEPKGRLTKAEWKRRRAEPGDRLGLHVEAQGCEGAFLSIHVEKQQEDGSWEVYTRWQGKIESGKYDGVFAIPPRLGTQANEAAARFAADKGRIVELSFERAPVDGGRAWMQARLENLDKTQIRFVLERADERGNWVEIGSAVSTVRKGAARNSVPVPPLPASPEHDGKEPRDPVRFAIIHLQKTDDVVLSIDPEWLKGRSYQVVVERRLLGEESWQRVSTVQPRPSPPAAGQPTQTPAGPPAQVPPAASAPPPPAPNRANPAAPPPSSPGQPAPPPVAVMPRPAPAPVPAQPHPVVPPPVVATHPPSGPPTASIPPPPSGPQAHPTAPIGGVPPIVHAPTATPRAPTATPRAPTATPVIPIAKAPIAPAPPPPPPVMATPVQAIPAPVQVVPPPTQAIPTPVLGVPPPIQAVPFQAVPPVQAVPPPVQSIPTPVQAVPPPPQTVPAAAQPFPQPAQGIPSQPTSPAGPTPPPTPAASPDIAVPPPQPDLGSAGGTAFAPPEPTGGPGAFPSPAAGDGRSLPSLADAPSAPGYESFPDTLSKARKAKERVEDTADKLADARKKADESGPDEGNIEE